MRKALALAVPAIVVIATVVLALVLFKQPTTKDYLALVGLVIAELYIAGITHIGFSVKEGDSNNFLPALVATIPVLIVSIIVIATSPGRVVIAVLEIIGWAIALIGLTVSWRANLREADNAKNASADPLHITPGKA